MSSKRILNVSHFGMAKKENKPREDKMDSENYIPVSINEIDFFELNPRKLEN